MHHWVACSTRRWLKHVSNSFSWGLIGFLSENANALVCCYKFRVTSFYAAKWNEIINNSPSDCVTVLIITIDGLTTCQLPLKSTWNAWFSRQVVALTCHWQSPTIIFTDLCNELQPLTNCDLINIATIYQTILQQYIMALITFLTNQIVIY